ncbi:MAG: VanW family protein [Bacillota bacterium]|nr:VanW family protein [Bacillota bacterium]MDW7682519.1 VanW family protein [Bacillota bacterium]
MTKQKRAAYLKLTSLVVVLTICAFLLVSFNLGMKAKRYFYGVRPGVTLEGVMMESLLEGEVREKVAKIAERVERAPRNARYDNKNNVIVAELPGLTVDVRATAEAVMQAQENESVDLALIRLEPEITSEIFRSINSKVAEYSTSGGGSAGRTDNLYMAAKYMNGYVLGPGDVFSFNGVTGPRTIERGYSMAPVVGGRGIGGGVCQVATTIYNVAMIADMEIVERHPHSIQVGYVPPGRDATVTNYIDFKFRNSTDKFMQIRSGAGGGHVWVQLWSQ